MAHGYSHTTHIDHHNHHHYYWLWIDERREMDGGHYIFPEQCYDDDFRNEIFPVVVVVLKIFLYIPLLKKRK